MDVERKHSRKFFLHIFPRGFTTSEVLICVVIILILATLAMAGYTQVMDNAYQRVCATNQTIIMKSIDRHFLTTGIAPATLGDINIEHWKDAYAGVMKNRDWQTKLSYFLVKITAPRQACAAITQLEHLVTPAEMKIYGIMADVFRCPADTTPGSPSYGINSALLNYSRWSNVFADMDIIADCDSYTFSSEEGLSYRHKRKLCQEKIAQTITKSMRVKKHTSGMPAALSASTPVDSNALRNTIEQQITERREQIAALEAEIAALEAQIAEYREKLQNPLFFLLWWWYYYVGIPRCEERIEECNAEIQQLQQEIVCLEAELSAIVD